MSHSASALGPSSLGLLAPVEASHLLGGVAAGSALLLLLVVGGLATSSAGGVGVRVLLTEGGSSFALRGDNEKKRNI